jgi:hypothetical protein
MEPVLKPVSPNQSFWNPTNWIPIFGDHILWLLLPDFW